MIEDMGKVRSWAIFCVIAVTMLTRIDPVQVSVGLTGPVEGSSPDAMDLVFDIEGFVRDAPIESSYSEYSAFLRSMGISDYFADYLYTSLCGTPKRILTVVYVSNSNQKSVVVEIHEYESRDQASSEYNVQVTGQGGYLGRIFRRFDNVYVLLHRGQFMVYIFCCPADDADSAAALRDYVPKYVESLFAVLPEPTEPPEPPLVDFTGRVVWGIHPGDIITWGYNETLFTGYVGGGMSQKEASYEIKWEIITITEDNLAVLIKILDILPPSDFDYYSSWRIGGLDLDLPTHYDYFWGTAVNPPGKEGFVLVSPCYVEGQTLKDVMEPQLGEYEGMSVDTTETAEYITCHGKVGTQAGGYTPVETMWEDITMHKGTGIVTSISYYYNNNEYSITKSASIALKKTNFDLGSRMPPLTVPAATSPATIYSGGTTTVGVSVISGGTAITGATVSFTSAQGGTFSDVTDHADGTYTATFTAPEVTGQTTYAIAVSASKSGYIGGSGQTQVTVQPLVLNIYVKDADGNPLADATVASTFQPSDQTPLSGTTDTNGLASFTGVLKGSYTIRTSKSGYEDNTWTGTVEAGQMTTETITIATPFPWTYLIAGVAAAVIVVGALVALKMRKPKNI